MPASSWSRGASSGRPVKGEFRIIFESGKRVVSRISSAIPFSDVISSSPTRPEERRLYLLTSLKPQSFMLRLSGLAPPCRSCLRSLWGRFDHCRSISVGYRVSASELDPAFFNIARNAIHGLATGPPRGEDNSQADGRSQFTLTLRPQLLFFLNADSHIQQACVSQRAATYRTASLDGGQYIRLLQFETCLVIGYPIILPVSKIRRTPRVLLVVLLGSSPRINHATKRE